MSPLQLTTALFVRGRFSSALVTYSLNRLVGHTTVWDRLADPEVFTAFSVIQLLFFYFFVISLYRFCLVPAAATLHTRLAKGVLFHPMSFFQSTSISEILNLFTSDLGLMDGSLNQSIVSLIAQYANLCLACFVLVFSSPPSILFVVPVIYACVRLQSLYLSSMRQLRYLDISSRAPLLGLLQDPEAGRLLIEIYGRIESQLRFFEDCLKVNLSAMFPLVTLDVWLFLRLEILSLTLQMLAVAQLETDAVSITRVQRLASEGEDIAIPSKELGGRYTDNPENDIPSGWPLRGRVEAFDTPAALVARDDGPYASMLAEAGLLESARKDLLGGEEL